MKAILPNNKIKCRTSSKNVFIHGFMIYSCKGCGKKFKMYLETGVEDDRDLKKHQPCPFAIGCPYCGQAHAVDISGVIKTSIKPISDFPNGTMYFAYDDSGHEMACGKPTMYSAIRRIER